MLYLPTLSVTHIQIISTSYNQHECPILEPCPLSCFMHLLHEARDSWAIRSMSRAKILRDISQFESISRGEIIIASA